MSKCDFCDEFAGGSANAYAIRYGPSRESRIVRTGRYHVLPTLGQLTEGHLLILPIQHFCALGDMPHDMLVELIQVRDSVRELLTKTYGQCIFFEHGVRGVDAGGCGVAHAHMHAVPVAEGAVLDTLQSSFQGHSIRSFEELNAYVPNSSYLYFENSLHQAFVFSVRQMPSQFLRKLVAQSVGNPHWDWRFVGIEPEIAATLARISSLFSTVHV